MSHATERENFMREKARRRGCMRRCVCVSRRGPARVLFFARLFMTILQQRKERCSKIVRSKEEKKKKEANDVDPEDFLFFFGCQGRWDGFFSIQETSLSLLRGRQAQFLQAFLLSLCPSFTFSPPFLCDLSQIN